MRFFIDCEWNSYKGDLISIALVAEDNREFYEVLKCDNPEPWVAENVIPKLGKDPVHLQELQLRLQMFLFQYDTVHVVSDWPEDTAWFCTMLITGPGKRMNTPPLTFEILRVDSKSANPHCALDDARGLHDSVSKTEANLNVV